MPRGKLLERFLLTPRFICRGGFHPETGICNAVRRPDSSPSLYAIEEGSPFSCVRALLWSAREGRGAVLRGREIAVAVVHDDDTARLNQGNRFQRAMVPGLAVHKTEVKTFQREIISQS